MANLDQIINQKAAADAEWKEQRQMERQATADIRDAGITEITSSPEEYARYLDMQGDNPAYSAGNVAVMMFSAPEATQFGTKDRWKSLGRTILDAERDKGVKIFAKMPYPGRGYKLSDAYDIKQTQGQAVKGLHLRDGTHQMETALTTLLNYSPVPVVTDKEIPTPAFYDENNLELAINPEFPDSEAFAAIATEVTHARLHNKGANRFYNRADSALDAESVSYILCKQFHVARDMPDTSQVSQLYEGWEIEDRTDALAKIHDMSKQIGRSIERDITPQQRNRAPVTRPAR